MTTQTKEPRQLVNLLHKLQANAKRYVDMLVPIESLMAAAAQIEKWTANGVEMKTDLVLKDENGLQFSLNDMSIPQLCSRIGPNGAGAQIIPAKYVNNLTEYAGEAGYEMAAENLQFWLNRTATKHANRQVKQFFVRLVADCDLEEGTDPRESSAQFFARAILSDKFFRLDNLDIMQAVHGAIKELTDDEKNHRAAAGVKVLNWRLSDNRMDMMLVNPSMAFDLKNPERGLITEGLTHSGGTGHQFLKLNDGYEGGSHLVYPAARVSNSETGHGGINILGGLFEAICANGCTVGHNIKRRHVGSVLSDDAGSQKTAETKRELIRCEISDQVGAVFCEETFLANCQKFAATFGIEIEGPKVKEVVAEVVAATKLPQSIIDDILTAYAPLDTEKHTLGDVQRAVTNVANGDDITDELARDLEDAGGKLLDMTEKRQRKLVTV